MPFPPNFDNVWSETFPPDTQPANLLGQDIRSFKTDIRERVALISGTIANRPTPEAVWGGVNFGMIYFSTDTGQMFQWNGAAWVDISASILGAQAGALGPARVVASNTIITAATQNNTLYTVPTGGAGIYQVDSYAQLSAVTGSGITLTWALNWTDAIQAQTFNYTAGANFSTVGARIGGASGGNTGQVEIYASVGNIIQFAFTIASFSGGTATLTVYYRVTYKG